MLSSTDTYCTVCRTNLIVQNQVYGNCLFSVCVMNVSSNDAIHYFALFSVNIRKYSFTLSTPNNVNKAYIQSEVKKLDRKSQRLP